VATIASRRRIFLFISPATRFFYATRTQRQIQRHYVLMCCAYPSTTTVPSAFSSLNLSQVLLFLSLRNPLAEACLLEVCTRIFPQNLPPFPQPRHLSEILLWLKTRQMLSAIFLLSRAFPRYKSPHPMLFPAIGNISAIFSVRLSRASSQGTPTENHHESFLSTLLREEVVACFSPSPSSTKFRSLVSVIALFFLSPEEQLRQLAQDNSPLPHTFRTPSR
jgi:hypothetical protein